ncbi:MAG TPA: hypothetical protein VKY44_08655 [Flavobacterium sp.]|nr:hypothetical protein [Flavobacterium sp.]
MNGIKVFFIGIFSFIIGILLLIISITFLIISFPFLYHKRKQFEKRYSDFLIQNDNLNFFCYNNRKNSQYFIENEIIPFLDDKIEIVFLNGKIVETPKYPKDFISKALFQLKNYSKFPHLMKIRNGKLIDKSINLLFYSIKNQVLLIKYRQFIVSITHQ